MISRDKKSNTAQDDLEYFSSLFQKYSRLMFFTAERYINNGVDVDDIVQESFAKLLLHKEKLKTLSGDALSSYIYFTVKNTCINQQKNHKRVQEHELSYDALNESVILKTMIPFQQIEDNSSIEKMLNSLPDNERMLLTYKYLLDYSDSEISNILGCKPDSVRMMLSRARRKALQLLRGEEDLE